MIARNHIGQHFLVSVSNVRWRVRVVDRRGDEKRLRHYRTNCRTNRCRASASLAGWKSRVSITQIEAAENSRSPSDGPLLLAGIRSSPERRLLMTSYFKILFSILAAAICILSFAADKPSCQKTGKNCPMNDGKACNCGKSCTC